jgi:GNAT superfamily N-acetyltransferase
VSYRFRLALPDDIRRCVFIRGRTRENALSEEALALRGVTEAGWRRDVETGRLFGHVCTAGEEIVGYCFADRETGEIVVLALLPEHEFKGIGKALISVVTDDLRGLGFARIFLECTVDPRARSHGFYRHLGWVPTGEAVGHGDEILERRL